MLNVIQGPDASPRRTVIYGTAGIGKTMWAANADSPLFILTEDGRPHKMVDGTQVDADRLPLCHSLADIQQQLRSVLLDDHDYRTLVIDSLDRAQPMVFAQVCTDKGLGKDKNITDIGYNKGYEAAVSEWHKLCFVMDKIRIERNMRIILIAHAKVERYEDPSCEAYDRHVMQLHKLSAAEIIGWADEVLFATYKTYTRKDGTGFNERRVGVGVGDRVVYTTERPSYIAKNRLGLPEELPLDYAALAAYYTTPVAGDGPPSTVMGSSGEPAQPATANNEGGSGGNSAAAAVVDGPSDTSAPPSELTALGFTELDLDDMDATGLRECALLLADKMSAASKAKFKTAFQKSDLAKMKAVIVRAMNKPDVSAITDDNPLPTGNE